MILIMACSVLSQTTGEMHGKTSTDRHGVGCAGASAGHRSGNSGRPALCAGGAAARIARRHPGGDGCCAGRGASHRRQTPGSAAPQGGKACGGAAELGRPTPRVHEYRTRARISRAMDQAGRRGWRAGCLTIACCTGPGARAPCSCFSGVSHADAPWLAQGRPGHSASQERPSRAGGMEKNLPEALAALLSPKQVCGRRVRLMFQDEARFGRMVRIRRCWAPAPERPVVNNGYERQFVYVYGGVSPIEGELDWMICPKMNTERMSEYLAQVTTAHPNEFMV